VKNPLAVMHSWQPLEQIYCTDHRLLIFPVSSRGADCYGGFVPLDTYIKTQYLFHWHWCQVDLFPPLILWYLDGVY